VDRRLPPSVLQQVQEGNDVVEIISGYVALKKSGQNYVGLCPFHGEKSPSFTVSPAKQLFHCFGCGAGGNLFTFIMKMEGLTFPEAVRSLSQRIGLVLSDSSASNPEVKQKNRLRALLQAAAQRFQEQLLTDARSAKARAYLAGRGVTETAIDSFGLGYALPGWDSLMTPLVRKGWTAQELMDAGLIIRRNDNNGYYDRFRDRIIFPIRDLQGQVVGFGARAMPDGPDGKHDSQPKYLNSPETALYSKGRILYGLDRARSAAARAGYLVVVEGYFDAIAPHQAGYAHVVATLGTALTTSHLAMLQRLVPRVVLLFDPDPAGVNATLRTVELFLEHGMDAGVATLPAGEDPDSFLHRFGLPAFEERIAAAQPLLAFAIERALTCTPHGQIEGKKAVIRSLAPTLRKVQSRLELDHYLRVLAQRLDVSEASLRTDLARTIPAHAADRRTATPSPSSAAKSAMGKSGGTGMRDGRDASPSVNSGGVPPAGPTWLKEERMLLHLWFQRRISTAELTGRIGPDEMSHPAAQALMRLIVESADWEAEDPVAAVSARASANESLAAVVAELSLLELEYDSVPKAVEECLYHLNRRRLEQRIRQLEEERRAAEKDGDQPRVQALQAAILDSRRSLGAGPSNKRVNERANERTGEQAGERGRTAPVGLG
jgi:DNA primase